MRFGICLEIYIQESAMRDHERIHRACMTLFNMESKESRICRHPLDVVSDFHKVPCSQGGCFSVSIMFVTMLCFDVLCSG